MPELPAGVEFRLVPGAFGYGVDAIGGVWSRRRSGRPRKGARQPVVTATWRKLATTFNRRGYPCVRVGGRFMPVHRLVLQTFVGPRPAGMQCRHLNDIKTDNRRDNLCWGTLAENVADKIRNGRQLRGERAPGARLTDSQVEELRSLDGTLSQRELARRFNTSQGHIWNILRGRRWRHVRQADHPCPQEAAGVA